MPNKEPVTIVGAGLAGSEAAFQLAKRGLFVKLIDMKPAKKSPAHKSDDFCELVCSNSLRSDRLQNGAGLLKEEMRRLDSLIMSCAEATRVDAGGALAVDRESFAQEVTKRLRENKNIEIISAEVESLPDTPAIIATGPLSSGALMEDIEKLFGEGLHFYDAAAPIITADSIDMTKAYRATRYGHGNDDYINCAMNREQYFEFIRAITTAQCAELHEFETPRVFEGCMPVEIMAKRGDMTLAFGPLRPVGLNDPRTGQRPFAVVQLRQDDAAGTLYNIVGFQTNLKFSEQKRVFSMIPGLENANFIRYGVMHRNTFINSPRKLDYCYMAKARPNTYFAGQLTGVEGYIESAASGFVAGIELALELNGQPRVDFTKKTALGALAHYVSEYAGKDFQPMNISFGIIEPLDDMVKNKQLRYEQIVNRSLSIIDSLKDRLLL